MNDNNNNRRPPFSPSAVFINSLSTSPGSSSLEPLEQAFQDRQRARLPDSAFQSGACALPRPRQGNFPDCGSQPDSYLPAEQHIPRSDPFTDAVLDFEQSNTGSTGASSAAAAAAAAAATTKPSSSSKPQSPRSRPPSPRPRMTGKQLEILEGIYHRQTHPATVWKRQLARDFDVEYHKVDNWFQNRRAKTAKAKAREKEEEKARLKALSNLPTKLGQPADWQNDCLAYRFAAGSDSLPATSTAALDSILAPAYHRSAIQAAADRNEMISAMHASNMGGSYNMPPDESAWLEENTDCYGNGFNFGSLPFPQMHSATTALPAELNTSFDFSQFKHEPEFPSASTINSSEVFPDFPQIQEQKPQILDLDPMQLGTTDAAEMDEVALLMSKPGADLLLFENFQQNLLNASLPCAPQQNESMEEAPRLVSKQDETAIPSPRQSSVFESQPISRNMSQHVSPHTSPSPIKLSPAIPQAVSLPASTWSRRSSTTAELANNLSSIHFMRAASQQQNSADQGFMVPAVPGPRQSLAARRNKNVGLLPTRTVSYSGAGILSPSSRSATLPQNSVRRIKSAGNCLSTTGAGIKKHSPRSSSQRSPLKSSAEQELSILAEQQQQQQQQSSDTATAATLDFQARCSGLQDDYIGGELNNEHAVWASSPPSEAPPLSASYGQLSFDESAWSGSTPIMCGMPSYVDHNPYLNSLASSNPPVPQSAPAHITTFPNMNHHSQSLGSTSNATSSDGFLVASHRDIGGPPLYSPTPMPAPTQQQAQMERLFGSALRHASYSNNGRPGSSPGITSPQGSSSARQYLFGQDQHLHQHQRQHMHVLLPPESLMSMSSMSGHSPLEHGRRQPSPPQNWEFQMVTFADPPKANRAPEGHGFTALRGQSPRIWTFQNCGPANFATNGNGSGSSTPPTKEAAPAAINV